MPEEKKRVLEGVCHFHSETGTEGGYWAFQDKNFIKPNTTRFSCTKCNRYWDKKKNPNGPPRLENGKYCLSGEHDFKSISKENWSYEGLHILENGDKLTIFSLNSPKIILWSGTISLREYPLFTHHVFGLWVHSNQNGVEREKWAKWFFKGNPAQLICSTK